MAEDPNKSEASLHTVDLETLEGRASEPPEGDDLCTSCWVLFDGKDEPTCPSCGELRPEQGWSSLPYSFLDRYVFLELLGRGGVGAVFRARHVDASRGDQQFAVKVIQQGARPERRRLLSQMFEREISAAALVGRSRHFVRVLGHDTGDHLHLAMEYVPWPTLKSRLKREGVMAARDVARLGIALLRAVEVMHAHNLVHRDLKPANLFVTEEDGEIRVKVADLGLWILSEDRRGDVTESLPAGTFAGTLDYASPEQLDGVGIGLPSDLHAVGSILWAASTGDVPFPAMGATFIASMRAKRQLVEAIPARPEPMPEALYYVLARALEPRVEDRFATAHDFATALENLVQDPESFSSTVYFRPTVPTPQARRGTPQPAPSEGSVSGERASKPLPRWPLVAAGAVVVVGLGYATASTFLPDRSGNESSAGVVAAAASSPSATPSPRPSAERTPEAPKLHLLAVGHRHSCAIAAGGSMHCWGANERGQLGDGTTIGRSRPVPVAGPGQIEQVVLGAAHTCARKSDGTVWCWGDNGQGELGDGKREPRAAPRQVLGLPKVRHLFGGACQTWALTETGEAWGWGCDRSGQLGSGAGTKETTPRRIDRLDGAVTVAHETYGSGGEACALFRDRPAICWQWGRLPKGARAAAIDGTGGIEQVVFAGDHGCARFDDGKARCWGRNQAGQLGDGTRKERRGPVELASTKRVEQLVAGEGYGCARVDDGRVLCWGRNDRGQTAGRGPEDKLVPAEVGGIAGAVDIATDMGRTCAVLRDGRVGCWGDGLSSDSEPVVWMEAMKGAASIVASGHGVICSLHGEAGAACLGDDESGQLGAGRALQRHEPLQVVGLKGVERVWATARNACALDDAGVLWCWGSNQWGAFPKGAGTQPRPLRMGSAVVDVSLSTRGLYTLLRGDAPAPSGSSNAPGSVAPVASTDVPPRAAGVRAGGNLLQDHGAGASAQRAYPQAVPGLDRAAQIAAGVKHACARMADGSVSCWGDNTYGQLGDGSPRSSRRPVPALVQGPVAQIVSGAFHTCALRQSGSAVCWGINDDGQSGPGPTWTCNAADRVYACLRRPRRVIGVHDAIALGAGQWHTCALRRSGSISCWGANKVGQLGDGTTDKRPEPQPVLDISNATQLSVGERHACAALRDGAVWCWGDNGYGELGRLTEDKCEPSTEPCGPKPGPVRGMTDAVAVAAGWEFSCAVRKDKTVWCWGNNQRGALGDGEPIRRDRAVRVVW